MRDCIASLDDSTECASSRTSSRQAPRQDRPREKKGGKRPKLSQKKKKIAESMIKKIKLYKVEEIKKKRLQRL